MELWPPNCLSFKSSHCVDTKEKHCGVTIKQKHLGAKLYFYLILLMTNFLYLKSWWLPVWLHNFFDNRILTATEKGGMVESLTPFLTQGGILHKYFQTQRDSNLSTTLYTTYCMSYIFTHSSFLTILLTKCVGFFPHQAILQFSANTSWVSYNSIQFWYYLPGHNIRSHRLRPQSHKTALLQMPIRSPGCYQLAIN